MVDDIGKVIGETTYIATSDTGDFSIHPALFDKQYKKLQKKTTDYAKAVGTQYYNTDIQYYRGIDFLSFLNRDYQMPHYRYSNAAGQWWFDNLKSYYQAYAILASGNKDDYSMHNVLGVVVCIR